MTSLPSVKRATGQQELSKVSLSVEGACHAPGQQCAASTWIDIPKASSYHSLEGKLQRLTAPTPSAQGDSPGLLWAVRV